MIRIEGKNHSNSNFLEVNKTVTILPPKEFSQPKPLETMQNHTKSTEKYNI